MTMECVCVGYHYCEYIYSQFKFRYELFKTVGILNALQNIKL